MILMLAIWAALGGTLYTIATTHPPMEAFVRWTIGMTIACIIAGVAIRSQPIGEATMFGRLGGSMVRWGFRAGHGSLWAGVGISWLVWLVIGAGAIAAIHYRNDLQLVILSLGWTSQVLVLFYVIGLWLSNSGANRHFRNGFVSMSAVVLVTLLTSVFLWFRTSGGTRNIAVIIAAIPLGASLLYGAFVLSMVLIGHKGRWN